MLGDAIVVTCQRTWQRRCSNSHGRTSQKAVFSVFLGDSLNYTDALSKTFIQDM